MGSINELERYELIESYVYNYMRGLSGLDSKLYNAYTIFGNMDKTKKIDKLQKKYDKNLSRVNVNREAVLTTLENIYRKQSEPTNLTRAQISRDTYNIVSKYFKKEPFNIADAMNDLKDYYFKVQSKKADLKSRLNKATTEHKKTGEQDSAKQERKYTEDTTINIEYTKPRTDYKNPIEVKPPTKNEEMDTNYQTLTAKEHIKQVNMSDEYMKKIEDHKLSKIGKTNYIGVKNMVDTLIFDVAERLVNITSKELVEEAIGVQASDMAAHNNYSTDIRIQKYDVLKQKVERAISKLSKEDQERIKGYIKDLKEKNDKSSIKYDALFDGKGLPSSDDIKKEINKRVLNSEEIRKYAIAAGRNANYDIKSSFRQMLFTATKYMSVEEMTKLYNTITYSYFETSSMFDDQPDVVQGLYDKEVAVQEAMVDVLQAKLKDSNSNITKEEICREILKQEPKFEIAPKRMAM